MKFNLGDIVCRTGIAGPTMKRGSLWKVIGVELSEGGHVLRIKVPRNGWYCASGFALAEPAPKPVQEAPKTIPHKWAKEIIAWANGAEIEVRYLTNGYGWTDWTKCNPSEWNVTSTYEYRIKPEKKPDIVGYMRAKCPPDRPLAHYEANDLGLMSWATRNKTMDDNIQCTFDGETGKLKAVQLLIN